MKWKLQIRNLTNVFYGHCKISVSSLQDLKNYLGNSHTNNHKCDACIKCRNSIKSINNWLNTPILRFDQSEVVFDSVVNEFWLSNKHQNMATYKCDPCQKSYASKLNLDKHMKVFHLPGSVQCTFCGKEFKIQTYLDYHIQITHKAVDGEFKSL